MTCDVRLECIDIERKRGRARWVGDAKVGVGSIYKLEGVAHVRWGRALLRCVNCAGALGSAYTLLGVLGYRLSSQEIQ